MKFKRTSPITSYVKPNPVDPNYFLDKFGCVDTKTKVDTVKLFLKRGVPCYIHNAYYLKEYKINND